MKETESKQAASSPQVPSAQPPNALDGWVAVDDRLPSPVGDSRKLVWLEDKDGMGWIGIRFYHFGECAWYVGTREESGTVRYWRDLPATPAEDAADTRRIAERAILATSQTASAPVVNEEQAREWLRKTISENLYKYVSIPLAEGEKVTLTDDAIPKLLVEFANSRAVPSERAPAAKGEETRDGK